MESKPIFEKLDSLLAQVETTFSAMVEKFPEEIRCKPGCDDCCHACFDLSLIEATYLEAGLKTLSADQLDLVKEQARAAKQEFERLSAEAGGEESAVPLDQVSLWRIRCPLLGPEKQCMIYDFRPVTCRAYGLPTSINNKGHVCGFSGFDQGKTYPTIKLDQIFGYLYELSRTAATALDLTEQEAGTRRFIYQTVLEEI